MSSLIKHNHDEVWITDVNRIFLRFLPTSSPLFSFQVFFGNFSSKQPNSVSHSQAVRVLSIRFINCNKCYSNSWVILDGPLILWVKWTIPVVDTIHLHVKGNKFAMRVKIKATHNSKLNGIPVRSINELQFYKYTFPPLVLFAAAFPQTFLFPSWGFLVSLEVLEVCLNVFAELAL